MQSLSYPERCRLQFCFVLEVTRAMQDIQALRYVTWGSCAWYQCASMSWQLGSFGLRCRWRGRSVQIFHNALRCSCATVLGTL
jgi:hypothetical protein